MCSHSLEVHLYTCEISYLSFIEVTFKAKKSLHLKDKWMGQKYIDLSQSDLFQLIYLTAVMSYK